MFFQVLNTWLYRCSITSKCRGGVRRDGSSSPPPSPPHHRKYVILLPSQKAQHGVSTLLRHCFEWLHIVPISQRCVVAKNRRCESSCVTSAFSLRGSRRFCWDEGRNFEDDTRACHSLRLLRSIVSNRRVCFILKTETGICAKRCSKTYGSWDGGARRTRSCCCNRWK